MRLFFEYIQQLGSSSADTIWFPIFIWTAIAAIIFLVLRFQKSMNPLYQYHIRVATLLALPFGLISAALLKMYATFTTSTSFNVSIFVIDNPLPVIYPAADQGIIESSINWLDVNFLIGFATSVFIIIAAFMLTRLVVSYLNLIRLHKSLPTEKLSNTTFIPGLENSSIYVAFHNHPLVPFTFGWKKPIIVLPKKIKEDPEKLEMALQHELVHIRRGDYLLQLSL